MFAITHTFVTISALQLEICSSEKQMLETWLCNLILPLIETLSNPLITSKESKILNRHHKRTITKCYMLRSEKYSRHKLIHLPFQVCFFEVAKNSAGKLPSISKKTKRSLIRDFFLLFSKSDISLDGVLLMSQP